MSAATDSFVQNNQARFLEELKRFLRIPSISTLPEHRPDIDRAATIDKVDGCNPSNCSSRSWYPVGTPMIDVSRS